MLSKIHIIIVLYALIIPQYVNMTVIYIELNDYTDNQDVQTRRVFSIRIQLLL